MKKSKIIKRISVFILALGLVLQILPAVSPLKVAAASADSGSVNTTPFPIDYDPNDGMIKYGHSGEVGFRPENDYDNF